MEILFKVIKILSLFGIIYLWNHFIVSNMIKSLVRFHKKNNQENLNKQPTKFLVQNEKGIINFAFGFYWVGAFIMVYGIIFD